MAMRRSPRPVAVRTIKQLSSLESRLSDAAAEIESLSALVTRQSEILRCVVRAVRGKPPPDTFWSVHDAGELTELTVRLLKEALKHFDSLPPVPGPQAAWVAPARRLVTGRPLRLPRNLESP